MREKSHLQKRAARAPPALAEEAKGLCGAVSSCLVMSLPAYALGCAGEIPSHKNK